jgi:hypothetical protein
MTKGKTVQLVLNELKRAMGNTMPSRELVVLAHKICAIHAAPWREGYNFINDPILANWPEVDVAIADGGWSELSRHAAANDNMEFEDGRAHVSVWNGLNVLKRYA